MNVKTFKIGEYAKGGVITVEINGWGNNIITVIGKNWDTSKGFSKNSNQSNAKEFTRKTFMADNTHVKSDLFMFLTDLTTAYYADQIREWIESKTKLAGSRWL